VPRIGAALPPAHRSSAAASASEQRCRQRVSGSATARRRASLVHPPTHTHTHSHTAQSRRHAPMRVSGGRHSRPATGQAGRMPPVLHSHMRCAVAELHAQDPARMFAHRTACMLASAATPEAPRSSVHCIDVTRAGSRAWYAASRHSTAHATVHECTARGISGPQTRRTMQRRQRGRKPGQRHGMRAGRSQTAIRSPELVRKSTCVHE